MKKKKIITKRWKMGTTKTRQDKIDFMRLALQSFFKNNPKGTISKKALLQKFALAKNTTTRTANEILNLFIIELKLKVDGDNITK